MIQRLFRPTSFIPIALFAALALPALAYTPGTGTLQSENFEDNRADGWEVASDASSWSPAVYGSSKVWDADGRGQLPFSPTLHKNFRALHPVLAQTFSTAFSYRAEGGAGFVFQFDIEQRAPQTRFYRLQVDINGKLTLQRANGGPFTVLAGTANGFVPFSAQRWMRFEIGASGAQQVIRARVWSGSAAAEPTTWDLVAADPLVTLQRVHRVTVAADGPKGKHTRLDDFEIWGDDSKGIVSSITTIYICEWSHLDIGFTTTPQAIETFYKTELDQVLANLRADPDYKWTIEEYWQLDQWLKRSTATEKLEMFDRLREGRIHLTAGFASLVVGTVGHEELARTLYPATRLGRSESFPVRSYIQDDVPSSPFALPEMLSEAGVEYYLGGMNTAFGGVLTHPSLAERPFWWQGPEGKRVLAWHTYDGGYSEAFNYGFSWFDSFEMMFEKLSTKLPDNEAYGYPHDTLMIFKAFDNDYTGMAVLDRIRQWNATYETPHFVLAHPEEFLDLMRARLGDTIPTFTGDYGPGWSAGNGNHHMQDVRAAHRQVRSAEALGAVADVVGAGGDPRPDINHGYYQILVWDEHSGGGGWPGTFTTQEMVDSVQYFQDVAQDACAATAAALDEAATALATHMPSRGPRLLVFNGLAHTRDVFVTAALPADLFDGTFQLRDAVNGNEIAYQKDAATREILFRAAGLPGLGYRAFDLVPGTPTTPAAGMLSASASVLENDAYRLTIDPNDGTLMSFFSKSDGREMVDGDSSYNFNQIAHASHLDVTYGTLPTIDLASPPTVTIGEQGPVRASIRVAFPDSPRVATEYRLYRDDDRVEIWNRLDRNRMPLVLAGDSRTYAATFPFEIHNFSIRSDRTNRYFDPKTDNFERTLYFAYHDAEHTIDFWDTNAGVTCASPEVPTHDFEKMTVWNDSIPATNGLLFARLHAKSDEYEYEGGTVGPVDYEPGTSPFYDYHHLFKVHGPEHDPAAVSRFGFDALSPAPVRLIRAQSGSLPEGTASFVACDDPGLMLYTVKRAEDGPGLVLRMADLLGLARTVRISSDLLELSRPRRLSWIEEDRAALTLDGNDVLVPVGAFETVTIGVDAVFPLALTVTRNETAGTVRLEWLGGNGPYTVERAGLPDFTDAELLATGLSARQFEDPVLADGRTWFYRVH